MFNKIIFFKTLGLLFLSGTSLYAQEYKPTAFIGIQAAPTFCTYYSPEQNYYYTTTYEPKMGFIGGISTQINFSSRFAFHAEVNYEQLNYSHVITKKGDKFITVVIPPGRSVKTNFISIPLSFKYNFVKGERNNFFLHFGNYWNYMLNQRFEVILQDGTTLTQKQKRDNQMRIGLLAGIGFDRALTNRLHLIAEIRDHYTLLDDANAYLDRTTIVTNRSNSLGIMVSLIFGLGNAQTKGI